MLQIKKLKIVTNGLDCEVLLRFHKKIPKTTYYHFTAYGSDLSYLPKGLIVNGYLDVYGCKNIYALPEDLIVKGHLYIGRTNIKEISVNVEVYGNIYRNS